MHMNAHTTRRPLHLLTHTLTPHRGKASQEEKKETRLGFSLPASIAAQWDLHLHLHQPATAARFTLVASHSDTVESRSNYAKSAPKVTNCWNSTWFVVPRGKSSTGFTSALVLLITQSGLMEEPGALWHWYRCCRTTREAG